MTARQPPEILALYQFLHDRVRQLGPVTVDPQGRGIVFQVRARAIGLAPKDRWIDLTVLLKWGATQPPVRKVNDYGAAPREITPRERHGARSVAWLRKSLTTRRPAT